jgi:drug/metabolite transporter (DMT)-like permease
MLTGILLGLAAATSQSSSYIFSKLFVRRFQRSIVNLLVLSHIAMGVVCLAALPFIWPEHWPAARDVAAPLARAAGFYVVGQTGLFRALRRSDASRVAPLLGLKILMLVLLSILFLGQHFSTLQWIGALTCVVAAGILNASGGPIARSSLLWVLVACLGYSLSDMGIRALVDQFTYLGMFHGTIVSVVLAYIVTGLIALAALFAIERPTVEMWRYALPFAGCWLLAMCFLFACFGLIGVVFGNIVQSSRGLLSVLLGALLARAGMVHLEQRTTRTVFLLRCAGAVLMTAAIVLYSLGSR